MGSSRGTKVLLWMGLGLCLMVALWGLLGLFSPIGWGRPLACLASIIAGLCLAALLYASIRAMEA